MINNKELLNHMEKIYDDYLVVIDKIPIEDKILASREEDVGLINLEPWEISEIVQEAFRRLPEGLEDYITDLFDVVYEAISEALDRTRR